VYNLRYHLVSLVAVFIALTLGLFLGSMVAERGYLDEQQSGLVEGLQKDFDELRSANDELRIAFERDRAFVNELSQLALGDALAGRRVVVLANEGRSDGLAAVTGAVEAAGGTVVTAMASERGMGLEDTDVRARLQSVVSTESVEEAGTLDDAIATALAAEWMDPFGEEPVTAVLVEEGLLDMSGHDPEASVDGMVVLASWDGEADTFACTVGGEMRDAGGTAVGVETTGVETGVTEACSALGLSAVDAVDLPQGTVSVVWVLADRAEGYFGVGDGASSLFPQIAVEEELEE
jgi:hypothetical protein